MEISIRGRHLVISEPLELYAKRRLRFSIGAFERWIGSVEIRVEDVNGPRGGIDKTCVIAIVLRPVGRVLARAKSSDAYTAVDRAAGRIRAVLVRRLGRLRGRPGRNAVQVG